MDSNGWAQSATQNLTGEILVDHDTFLKREQRKEPFQIYKDIQKGHDEKT